jgi:hypothetical protein
MSYCDQNGCTGRHGQPGWFQDCLTAAIFQDSLDGCNDEAGPTEEGSYYALMVYEYDAATLIAGTNTVVHIPAGSYIIESGDDRVNLESFWATDAAHEAFEAYSRLAVEWLGKQRL